MKFSCQKCGRVYVADDQVKGRAFKMKCRRCGETIVVRPGQAAPPPDGAPRGPGSVAPAPALTSSASPSPSPAAPPQDPAPRAGSPGAELELDAPPPAAARDPEPRAADASSPAAPAPRAAFDPFADFDLSGATPLGAPSPAAGAAAASGLSGEAVAARPKGAPPGGGTELEPPFAHLRGESATVEQRLGASPDAGARASASDPVDRSVPIISDAGAAPLPVSEAPAVKPPPPAAQAAGKPAGPRRSPLLLLVGVAVALLAAWLLTRSPPPPPSRAGSPTARPPPAVESGAPAKPPP